MSARTFTDRQGQYLAFIDAYTRVTGRPPAESDIQRRFGVSPPSVHQMVLTLEQLGLIRRRPGVARSIEVLLAPEHLPVLRHPEPAAAVELAAQPWQALDRSGRCSPRWAPRCRSSASPHSRARESHALDDA